MNEPTGLPEQFVTSPMSDRLLASVRRSGVTILEGSRGSGKTASLYFLASVESRRDGRDVLFASQSGFVDSNGKYVSSLFHSQQLDGKLILLDDADAWPLSAVANIVALTTQAYDSHIVVAASPGFYEDLISYSRSLDRGIQVISLSGLSNAAIRSILSEQVGEELSESEIEEISSKVRGSLREALVAAAQSLHQRRSRAGEDSGVSAPEPLYFLIDPGDATAEDLTRLYLAMSEIYRAYGGDGLVFDPDGTDVRVRAGEMR